MALAGTTLLQLWERERMLAVVGQQLLTKPSFSVPSQDAVAMLMSSPGENLSPITGGSPCHTEGLSQCFGTWLCFLFLPAPSSLVFIVKLQTFPSTSLRATTFPTLPSLETHEGSRKREVCDKQMGNRENSQTKRGMRRRREQGADSWPLG